VWAGISWLRIGLRGKQLEFSGYSDGVAVQGLDVSFDKQVPDFSKAHSTWG